jgi:hypothetical protein
MHTEQVINYWTPGNEFPKTLFMLRLSYPFSDSVLQFWKVDNYESRNFPLLLKVIALCTESRDWTLGLTT